MNYREYIDSGILQDYCLGLLSDTERARVEEVCRNHPEVKAELLHIQQLLEKQAVENEVKPHAAMRSKIWEALQAQDNEGALSMTNLPVITRLADKTKWLDFVKPMLPESLEEGQEFGVMLQNTGKVKQKLLMSRKNYPYEVHDDVVETLFVLEGGCTCEIDGKDYDFKTGDLIVLPVNIVHNLRVTTPHITLIVQHVAA